MFALACRVRAAAGDAERVCKRMFVLRGFLIVLNARRSASELDPRDWGGDAEAKEIIPSQKRAGDELIGGECGFSAVKNPPFPDFFS